MWPVFKSFGGMRRATVKHILSLSLLCSCSVGAQSSWFTMSGEPGDPLSDIVQVDPQSRTFTAGSATLDLRVSRAALRSSSDGIPFRSYTATVLVDCTVKTARFVMAAFYMMSLWEGRPHKLLTYFPSEVRPMLFSSIEPNPTAKIIRAACPSVSTG